MLMIVIDTNVMVSALRSSLGASHLLVQSIAERKVEYAISTTLIFEYEDAIKREMNSISLTDKELDLFLDSIVALGTTFAPFFLWRPFLSDPKDDYVLELAAVSRSEAIITYNRKDFKGIEKFGIQPLPPKVYLQKKGLIQ